MIDVTFIGGVDELYMISWSGDLKNPKAYHEHMVISLEEAQDMIKKFKGLLKYEQWNEIVYPPAHDVEEYYDEFVQ